MQRTWGPGYKKGRACIIYTVGLSLSRSPVIPLQTIFLAMLLETGRHMKFKIAQFDQEKRLYPDPREVMSREISLRQSWAVPPKGWSPKAGAINWWSTSSVPCQKQNSHHFFHLTFLFLPGTQFFLLSKFKTLVFALTAPPQYTPASFPHQVHFQVLIIFSLKWVLCLTYLPSCSCCQHSERDFSPALTKRFLKLPNASLFLWYFLVP